MPEQSPPPGPAEPKREAGAFLARYTAVIVKNVVGWTLMLAALGLGSFSPVPIGTPIFLIGFALITLPGKRRLTSSALRGIPIRLYTRKAFLWRLAISLLLPPAATVFLAFQRHPVLHPSQMTLLKLCVVYGIATAGAWVLTWIMLQAINGVVRILPRVRRRVRPWLRNHGVNLLPPRKKPRFPITSTRNDDEEILKFNRPPHLPWSRGEKS